MGSHPYDTGYISASPMEFGLVRQCTNTTLTQQLSNPKGENCAETRLSLLSDGTKGNVGITLGTRIAQDLGYRFTQPDTIQSVAGLTGYTWHYARHLDTWSAVQTPFTGNLLKLGLYDSYT